MKHYIVKTHRSRECVRGGLDDTFVPVSGVCELLARLAVGWLPSSSLLSRNTGERERNDKKDEINGVHVHAMVRLSFPI